MKALSPLVLLVCLVFSNFTFAEERELEVKSDYKVALDAFSEFRGVAATATIISMHLQEFALNYIKDNEEAEPEMVLEVMYFINEGLTAIKERGDMMSRHLYGSMPRSKEERETYSLKGKNFKVDFEFILQSIEGRHKYLVESAIPMVESEEGFFKALKEKADFNTRNSGTERERQTSFDEEMKGLSERVQKLRTVVELLAKRL